MRRGDVYLCPLGRRDDDGQEVLIPVVVLTRDAINQYGPVVVVAPIVDGGLEPPPYPSDVFVRAPDGGLTADGLVLTMQIRAIARAKLKHRLGLLSRDALADVDRALRITLDLEEE